MAAEPVLPLAHNAMSTLEVVKAVKKIAQIGRAHV